MLRASAWLGLMWATSVAAGCAGSEPPAEPARASASAVPSSIEPTPAGDAPRRDEAAPVASCEQPVDVIAGHDCWAEQARARAGAPAAAPRLRLTSVDVTPGLAPDLVERTFRHHIGMPRLCYEQGLRSNPRLRGSVRASFVIDRRGRISKSADAGSDVPDPAVVACVQRVLARMPFPQPQRAPVTVRYHIEFQPN